MKNSKSFSALVISLLLLSFTIFEVVKLNFTTGDSYVLNEDIKLTALLLLPVLILIFLKKKIWKVAFLAIVALSYTEYIGFSSREYALSFMSLTINLIPTALLFLHILVNRDLFDFFKKMKSSQS